MLRRRKYGEAAEQLVLGMFRGDKATWRAVELCLLGNPVMSRGMVNHQLRWLVSRGYVIKTERGRYSLTGLGLHYAALLEERG